LYEQASPASFISKDDPPMFFFHGAVDQIVPLASPRQMSEQLTAAGCDAQVYVVPNAGHGKAFLDPQAAAQAIKFLDEHLRPMAR
jgi:dipeptidyl aminopeptidase/acylaminoacyl peptidase